jgi:hypothetical protein
MGILNNPLQKKIERKINNLPKFPPPPKKKRKFNTLNYLKP